MTSLEPPEEKSSSGASRRSEARSHPSGPQCTMVSIVLIVLALILFVFGLVYAFAPAMSASSIQSIAVAIGLHTTPPPPDDAPQFYSWVGFTFSYMIAAGACALLASRPSPERMGYLNILLVLKGTSSLGGLVLFVRGPDYAFYLSTFLVDGLLFLLVLFLRAHLARLHAGGAKPSKAVDPAEASA